MARAILQGFAVSSGIAAGPAYFLNHRPGAVLHTLIPKKRIDAEVARLHTAVQNVSAELEETLANIPPEFKSSREIVDSHLLICSDPKLKGEAERHIREQRQNAEWALQESVELVAALFQQIDAPYIRERIQDVFVVFDKIMKRLSGEGEWSPPAGGKSVLLAYDISPSDVLVRKTDNVAAIVTEQGGRTAHTGIVARSLQIPAVVGVTGLESTLADGDNVIVDGFSGAILVEPSDEEIEAFAVKQQQFSRFQAAVLDNAFLPAETGDGVRVAVLANIDVTTETTTVIENGGFGAGLVRTEFGYITRPKPPTESELFVDYRELVQAFSHGQVTFRTLDVGSDKLYFGIAGLDEENPALGMRSIRYCMRHQRLFRRQLRALLRASAYGNVEIMFPFISGIEELRMAKSFLDEARQELSAEGIPFNPDIPVGAMIELPSSVMLADIFAKEVDFFSIGTNDLTQFTLGVDRDNRHVAHLFQSLHPAVIRSIKHVTDMAHEAGVGVSVCGEMAADPFCIPLLLGMPVDGLSVSAPSIPLVKHIVRQNTAAQCRELLAEAMRCPSTHSIRQMMLNHSYSNYPEDVPFFTTLSGSDG